jgi:hypothetical protein
MIWIVITGNRRRTQGGMEFFRWWGMDQLSEKS